MQTSTKPSTEEAKVADANTSEPPTPPMPPTPPTKKRMKSNKTGPKAAKKAKLQSVQKTPANKKKFNQLKTLSKKLQNGATSATVKTEKGGAKQANTSQQFGSSGSPVMGSYNALGLMAAAAQEALDSQVVQVQLAPTMMSAQEYQAQVQQALQNQINMQAQFQQQQQLHNQKVQRQIQGQTTAPGANSKVDPAKQNKGKPVQSPINPAAVLQRFAVASAAQTNPYYPQLESQQNHLEHARPETSARYTNAEEKALVHAKLRLQISSSMGQKYANEDSLLTQYYEYYLKLLDPQGFLGYSKREESALVRKFKSIKSKERKLVEYLDSFVEHGFWSQLREMVTTRPACVGKISKPPPQQQQQQQQQTKKPSSPMSVPI